MVRLNWSLSGGSPPAVFSLHSLSSPPPDPLGSKRPVKALLGAQAVTSAGSFQNKSAVTWREYRSEVEVSLLNIVYLHPVLTLSVCFKWLISKVGLEKIQKN